MSEPLNIISQNNTIALINIKNDIHLWDKTNQNGKYTKTPHNDSNKVIVAPTGDYWLVYHKFDESTSWENNSTLKFYKGENMILHAHNDNIFDYYKHDKYLADIIGFYVLDDKYLVLIIKGYNKGIHLYSIEIDPTVNSQNQHPKNQLISHVFRHTYYGNIYGSNQPILHCSNGHELFIINSENIYKYWFSADIEGIQLKTTQFNNRKFRFLDLGINLSIEFINGQIYLYRSSIKDTRFEIVDNVFAVFDYNVLIAIINPQTCAVENHFWKPIEGSYCLYLSKNLILEKNIKTGVHYLTITDDSNDGIDNPKILRRLNIHSFEHNFEPRNLYQKSFFEDDRYIVMMLNRTEYSKMLILQIDKETRKMTFYNYKIADIHNTYFYIGNGTIICAVRDYVYHPDNQLHEVIIKINSILNINKIDLPTKLSLPPYICDIISEFLQIKSINY